MSEGIVISRAGAGGPPEGDAALVGLPDESEGVVRLLCWLVGKKTLKGLAGTTKERLADLAREWLSLSEHEVWQRVKPESLPSPHKDLLSTELWSSMAQERTGCVAPLHSADLERCGYVQMSRARILHDAFGLNRGYCGTSCDSPNKTVHHTLWRGALRSSLPGNPYHCPHGWYRVSLEVDRKYLPDFTPDSSRWRTVYHGCAPWDIHKIIENGFRVRTCQHKAPFAYFSPSVEYSAHPRYARVFPAGDGMFYQYVLQVRIDKTRFTMGKTREWEVGPETLAARRVRIDPRIPNTELEYMLNKVDKPSGVPNLTNEDGVVVTGVLIRQSPVDPALLPWNAWWTLWKDIEFLHQNLYPIPPRLLPRVAIAQHVHA